MSSFTRRAVLMAGGAMTVLGAMVGRRAESAQAPTRLPAQPVLWLDASLPQSAMRADVMLQADLVAQWRSALRAQLRGSGKAVTAWVRWDKAMVLPGLAREEGWKTRTHSLGRGVFRVDVIV